MAFVSQISKHKQNIAVRGEAGTKEPTLWLPLSIKPFTCTTTFSEQVQVKLLITDLPQDVSHWH